MGDDPLRRDHGSGNGGGGLAHHSDARPQHGEIAACARICSGDKRRAHYSRRELLWHSAFDDTRDFHFDHGRGCGETFQWHEMESRRANHLGLAFYPAREWPCWLCAGAGRRGALISRSLWVKDRSAVRFRISRTFFSPFGASLAYPISILRDIPPKTARRDNRALPRPRTREPSPRFRHSASRLRLAPARVPARTVQRHNYRAALGRAPNCSLAKWLGQMQLPRRVSALAKETMAVFYFETRSLPAVARSHLAASPSMSLIPFAPF